MEGSFTGVIVAPLVTDANEARDIKAHGNLFFLLHERGVPMVKKVVCSIGKAKEYIKAGVGIAVGKPVEETTLLLDVTEYNVNGRQGQSIKLVEA